MKFIKKFETHWSLKYHEGQYILINMKDWTTNAIEAYNLLLPYGKIKEIAPLGHEHSVRLEVISDNEIDDDFWIYGEDIERDLEEDEIEKYKILKKSIKYKI